MTRQSSYQRGFVSDPIRTRRGIAFKIRYRVWMAAGNWKQQIGDVYGLSGKKAAREVLDRRIGESTTVMLEASELTLREFVRNLWTPALERRGLKGSTRESYDSALERHILPALGDCRIRDVAPLHIEQFAQTKSHAGLQPRLSAICFWSCRESSHLQWTTT